MRVCVFGWVVDAVLFPLVDNASLSSAVGEGRVGCRIVIGSIDFEADDEDENKINEALLAFSRVVSEGLSRRLDFGLRPIIVECLKEEDKE